MFEGLGKRLRDYRDLSKWLMDNQRKYNASPKTNADKAELEKSNDQAREWFANLKGP